MNWLLAHPADGAGESFYDLFDDWDLIVSSFLTQYGLRIRTKDFETVSWDEFKSLLAGIAPETPLGRIVAIRAETDKEVIKHFSKEQMRIYDEWRKKAADAITPADYDKEMVKLEMMFAAMCGGG